MGEIEAGPEGGAPRSVDGGDVVVHLRVGVEREPIADKGQPVGEVEGAKARAGIVAAFLDLGGRRGGAEETLQEGVEGDRRVALAAQITVRSKPNSRFSVGRKLIFSTCTHGSPGLTTFG